VAAADTGIRAGIERLRGWGSIKLPIVAHGPGGERDPIPESLRAVLAEVTRKAEAAGSVHRLRR
jgi:hypothetical protein